MSRSVTTDYEALRERQARAQEPASPCEAERRIRQAVYQIENALGTGRIDLAEIKDILVGRNTEQCPGNLVTSSKLRA